MISHNYELQVDLATIPDWETFRDQAEPYSIALDGKVKAPTREDMSVPLANYNHHDGVDRYSTKATCEQVFEASKMGLHRAFPQIIAMVNDCDQDVITCNAILRSPHHADSPLISRLVAMEGRLDAYGGAFNFDVRKMPFLENMSWIFEPYTEFKDSGGLQRGKVSEYERVIEDASSRVDQYAMGRAEQIRVDDRYEVIGKIGLFTEIERIGSMASLGLARDGVASTAEFHDLENGLTQVTLAKVDRFQRCVDMVGLAVHLNELEAEAGGQPDWGGGNAYCCSPRNLGTVLSREEIEESIRLFSKQ